MDVEAEFIESLGPVRSSPLKFVHDRLEACENAPPLRGVLEIGSIHDHPEPDLIERALTSREKDIIFGSEADL